MTGIDEFQLCLRIFHGNASHLSTGGGLAQVALTSELTTSFIICTGLPIFFSDSLTHWCHEEFLVLLTIGSAKVRAEHDKFGTPGAGNPQICKVPFKR